MRKTLALVFLSLAIAVINPILSASGQVPGLSPLPLPSQTEVVPLPVPIPIQPQIPRQPIPIPIPVEVEYPFTRLDMIGTDCTFPNQCLGWDEQIWGENGKPGDRMALLTSIDNSLHYMNTKEAIAAYHNYAVPQITLNRVRQSLQRFRELVVSSDSPEQLQAAVRQEFVFYKSVGNDGRGTVKFTAYYNPVYTASRFPTPEYRYPIYRKPSNFDKWSKPHPTRAELEGKDALLGAKSRLHGLEMYWFRDRFEAYMIHIQGSAQLNLTDGSTTSVSYAGATDYPWTSIGKQLLKDHKLPASGLTLPIVTRYFQQHTQEMNNYLPRWQRFVFFNDTGNEPAMGSLRVPVTAERSIATDKSLMPRGALAVVNTSLPYPAEGEKLAYHTVSRFVLDQDTGSAIKGPGRVDYYMGSGQLAGDRAGVTGGDGTLYYLLLKQ
ncbi:MAG: murein transglycosylase A [Rhizonema sp. PD37]|nr:murein transglycosylase A [Rhizonema sp. PD37]